MTSGEIAHELSVRVGTAMPLAMPALVAALIAVASGRRLLGLAWAVSAVLVLIVLPFFTLSWGGLREPHYSDEGAGIVLQPMLFAGFFYPAALLLTFAFLADAKKQV